MTVAATTQDGGMPEARPEVMHARYREGASLAVIAAEHGVTRQAVWELLARHGKPLRPRPAARPAVTYRGHRYTLRETGYYAATTGDRHLLHRRVWTDEHGPIPDGHDVHHRDGVKTNNDPSNLECLPKAEHTRRYSPHCNQHRHRCTKEHAHA